MTTRVSQICRNIPMNIIETTANQEKKKVLIIDDESIIGLSCKRILEKDNFEAVYCQDPKQGFMEAMTGIYDIILLDLLMPDMDGMEILTRIKSAGITSDVIIITGYGTVKNAVEAIKAGAANYVGKPVTPEELIITIENVIRHSDLVRENVSLRKELQIRDGFKGIIGESAAMKEVFSVIRRVAPTEGTVCITGESGTGKEMIAQAVHRLSRRCNNAFIACDCSSLVTTLLESELFGHVKGSFTGAVSAKQGLFEAADKGTLFLDEISNISLETQGKLLRVLETRQVKKVGDTKENKINIRLITASNRDLSKMVKEGSFREDLFYRIQGFPVFLPPLRERKDDIVNLALYFLNNFLKCNHLPGKHFSEEVVHLFESYYWPGNIRELKNIVERAAVFCDSDTIKAAHLPKEIAVHATDLSYPQIPADWEEFKIFKNRIQNEAVREIEKKFALEALRNAGGNISRAAKNIGMQRTNFHAFIQKLGIVPNDADVSFRV